MLDMIFFGHFAKDIIEVAGKKEVAAGGGVFYGGIAAIIAGARIAVITRYNQNDEAMIQPLKDAGATLYAQYTDSTSGLHNIYKDPTMETRECYPLGFAGTIQPSQIPRGLDAQYIMCTPIISGEIDMELLRYIAHRFTGKLCLDIQGFVRVVENNDVIFKDWVEKEEGLALVTVLKMDAAEARAITGKRSLKLALQKITSWGPKEILLTNVEGAKIFTDSSETFFFPWKAKSMDGRTGRGDTCFASYIASRLNSNIRESLKYAVTATSLKMEVPGPLSIEKKRILEYKDLWFSDQ